MVTPKPEILQNELGSVAQVQKEFVKNRKDSTSDDQLKGEKRDKTRAYVTQRNYLPFFFPASLCQYSVCHVVVVVVVVVSSLFSGLAV